ncbi:hypothetical protein VTO73DRAFT_13925 [Trametes versicolor]
MSSTPPSSLIPSTRTRPSINASLTLPRSKKIARRLKLGSLLSGATTTISTTTMTAPSKPTACTLARTPTTPRLLAQPACALTLACMPTRTMPRPLAHTARTLAQTQTPTTARLLANVACTQTPERTAPRLLAHQCAPMLTPRRHCLPARAASTLTLAHMPTRAMPHLSARKLGWTLPKAIARRARNATLATPRPAANAARALLLKVGPPTDLSTEAD